MTKQQDRERQLQAEIDAFARRCMFDFEYFSQTCLKIKTKSAGLAPFIFNNAQHKLHAIAEAMREKYGIVKIIIVKARQQGLSTYISGRGYWKTIHNEGTKTFLLAHEENASKNLLDMVRRYHDNCPAEIRPIVKKSNKSEITFPDIDASYMVGTAKTPDTGRGQTIHFYHGSEVAYFRHAEEIAGGLMEGIPEMPGVEQYLESTAAGFGGYFFDVWQNAAYVDEEPHANWNGWIRCFIPWFDDKDYRTPVPNGFEMTTDEAVLAKIYNLDAGQILWRRRKIAAKRNDVSQFQREYPACPEDAFNSALDNVLIQPELVIKARAKGNLQSYNPIGSRILGVDVAREGNDSTSFALRQGRVLFFTKRFNKLDNMEVAGQVIRAIKQFRVDFVCIDTTGGYGAGVYDRLLEMGFGSKLVAVNFASKPIQDDRYKNKRAEMWVGIRDWLEAGAQMPDKDSIQQDLCSVTYKHDSTGERLQLESKAEMKKRGLKSPDEGDAIGLTFARPSMTLSGGKGESFDPEEYFGNM